MYKNMQELAEDLSCDELKIEKIKVLERGDTEAYNRVEEKKNEC